MISLFQTHFRNEILNCTKFAKNLSKPTGYKKSAYNRDICNIK